MKTFAPFGPRITGKVGQIEASDNPKLVGKWTFEMFVGPIGGDMPEKPFIDGFIFETEDDAKGALRMAVKMYVNDLAKRHGVPEDEAHVIDMKTNEIKNMNNEN